MLDSPPKYKEGFQEFLEDRYPREVIAAESDMVSRGIIPKSLYRDFLECYRLEYTDSRRTTFIRYLPVIYRIDCWNWLYD